MALQLWLPLNGNLNSAGAVNATVTNNGATVDSNGKGGQCYNFASGNYMGIDANNVNNHKYSPISVALWVYPITSDTSERPAICCWESGGIGISTQNEQIVFSAYISSAYRYCYSAKISSNAWHHVCCIYDGTKMLVYVDGLLSGETSISGTITYHASCPWEIGGNPAPSAWGAGTFVGKLYDIRIYNHVLSQNEIADLSGVSGRTVTYKGKKIEAATITDFYNRLNVLINDSYNTNTHTSLTVPNLSNNLIQTAQIVTDLFGALTTTKSSTSYLNSFTLTQAAPEATAGTLLETPTNISRIEKNIGQMEGVCRPYCGANFSTFKASNYGTFARTFGFTSHNGPNYGTFQRAWGNTSFCLSNYNWGSGWTTQCLNDDYIYRASYGFTSHNGSNFSGFTRTAGFTSHNANNFSSFTRTNVPNTSFSSNKTSFIVEGIDF